MLAEVEPEVAAAVVALVGFLLGWACATWLRRQDHKTFVFARAPQLPIRALAAHDDAWLRGAVRADLPLQCPWFEIDCVAYSYSIEVEVTRTETVRDSDGKTRTETRTTWETQHAESESIDFDLDDGDMARIALGEGQNEAMASIGMDYETSTRRHSASALPVGTEVSVLGVWRDDQTFGPLAAVPLLVTRQTRQQRVQSSARSETGLFYAAMLFPFFGAVVAAGLATKARDATGWLVAAAIGLVILLPQWWLLTYNRLLRLRQRVKAAQKQIGIELAFRSDLVPNLVSVVRATAAHEHGLLADLAAIRSGGSVDDRIREERQSGAAMRTVLLLHERYPQLRSDTLYLDLHDRLWAIEEKLAHARSCYNDAVTEWNDRLQQFPSVLVARAARHREAEVFAAEGDEQLPPRLSDIPSPPHSS